MRDFGGGPTADTRDNGVNAPTGTDSSGTATGPLPQAPRIELPKGGGAIRGIGEKFAANPVTGTASMTVPIATSPGRSGFGPQLALSYNSGAGNGPFGFGWSLSVPSVTRKTSKGLPQYLDADESDVFVLSDVEDLVPELVQSDSENCDGDAGAHVVREHLRQVGDCTYRVRRYRPRIEGLFARIERWTNIDAVTDVHWRSISRDNVLSIYGKDHESRIFNPEDPSQIFSWLLCETRDDRGNAVVYTYKPEDGVGVDTSLPSERNRGERDDPRRAANRHLKRIRYCNQTTLLDEQGHRPPFLTADQLSQVHWLMEVVFDYGEHPGDSPAPHESMEWQFRDDAFSTYRAGFEVRTSRRCQRVLMFHHFPDERDVGIDCLVRSTNFDYSHERQPDDPRNAVYTFLHRVSQSGFKRTDDGYISRSVPPVEFEYTLPTVRDEVYEIDPNSLENLPVGVDGSRYQWVDVHGEGIPGILTEQAGTWYYKRNQSPLQSDTPSFGSVENVRPRPNQGLESARLLDLAGDGQLDLTVLDAPTQGFYEHDGEESWDSFRPFTSALNRNTRDPNLRFVDLSGDGLTDVLIAEDDAFVWHKSLAEEGFDAGKRVAKALEEETGPHVVFADGTQSVYLADMSGDGLADIVRVRNGEVCYWPNLGYGRFGAKVAMDDGPLFDYPDQFAQSRIRLADIDGSGTTDIIYLHGDGVRLYFNESGNGWSTPKILRVFPKADELTSIETADLFGNGTACLIWSSPLPTDSTRPMRYVNLMGEHKPHLLVKSINNLGAETHVHYAPSTKFYLADKRDGKPWITKIPFPVHVVERAEIFDRISGNRFVTRYAYHHGYFDGTEREFRGFGMVEQFDTEEFVALNTEAVFPSATNVDKSSHVPPVLTKTWFHTGVHVSRNHVSDFFAGLVDAKDKGEYYREPGLTDAQARELLLDDTVLPAGLTIEEEHEACRALKGSMLRQEVYALNGTDQAQHTYVVTEQNFTIRLEQPRAENRHAVFFAYARESIGSHYERDPADPRVAHTMTLEVDGFGNPLKLADISYGRRQSDPTLDSDDQTIQSRTLVSYTEKGVTNAIDGLDDFRTPLPAETRTYELTGYLPTGAAGRYQFSDLVRQTAAGLDHLFDYELNYEDNATIGRQRRLIEHMRTLYRPNDFGALLGDPLTLLPFGQVESLALSGESYKLAFTPGLLAQIYRRPLDLIQPSGAPTPETLVPNPTAILPVDIASSQASDRGGYVDLDSDDHWWIPTGRIFFSPTEGDTAAQERTHARQHFFLRNRFRDPFHTDAARTETFVNYDGYDLLVLETYDALDNRVTAGERDLAGHRTLQGNDYRVLQPARSMDPNRNRSMVAFDALGFVVGTAVAGKPEETLGDSLCGFVTDLEDLVVQDHLDDPLTDPHAILGCATNRLVYDLFAYHRTKNQPRPQPPVVYTLARETHDADLSPSQQTKIQHSFSYSDGFGREIQKKIQAESGPVPVRDADGAIVIGTNGRPEMTADTVSPRWVGSGWIVFNNKGKPVRQYEPFFTDRHGFEFDVHIGVSSVLFYDPMERVVATLYPNNTWDKVIIESWRQEAWDVNDTILVADPQNDTHVGQFFRHLPDGDYLPTWHAQRQAGALGPQEQAAANKAAVHSSTPTTTHFDSLGRTFLTVAHNKFKYSDTPPSAPPTEEFYATRVVFDIEGNERLVIDDKNRVIMQYDYCIAAPDKDNDKSEDEDAASTRIHEASMDSGERWTLNDVSGKPIRTWDSRGLEFRICYDPLRRPIESYLREGSGSELLVERTVYGESGNNPQASNLRRQIVQRFDQAGVVASEDFDFKGNLLRTDRQLSAEYKSALDWSALVVLEPPVYTIRHSYDALDRPIETTAPDNSVIQCFYNEANLLERVEANLRGAAVATPFVTDIDYDAKGQRTRIDYGNGVTTTYKYDPLTFRLVDLLTSRKTTSLSDDCPHFPPIGSRGCQVQNLHYTYDPSGNVTHIRDDAQQTIFFRNRRVEPSNRYTYDALYRLIEATGREHLGQGGGSLDPPTDLGAFNGIHTGLDHPGDGNAMGNYLERYLYDAVGNILEMQHRGNSPVNSSWTRSYSYNESSQLEVGKRNNRLTSTAIGAVTANYQYTGSAGLHGNITAFPHLSLMQWDFRDQLQSTAQQVVVNGTSETTWYVYDSHGQRVRKVTECHAAAGQTPARMRERIYLNGFEIYREYGNDGVTVNLVRETLHIMDDERCIALVETRTLGNEPGVPFQLIRYQCSNHLSTTTLELDNQARVISYEEYYPYGHTSYHAVRSQIEAPKRYRYTGKERDEESGFYYHGARYYVPWLSRWISPEAFDLAESVNVYRFVNNNPVRLFDPDGLSAWDFVKGIAVGAATAVVIVAAVAAAPVTIPTSVAIGLTAAGAAVTTATVVQSARQRDLLNNPISEEQAHFQAGTAIGGLVVAAGAGPISGSMSSAVRPMTPAFATNAGVFAEATTAAPAVVTAIPQAVGGATSIALPTVMAMSSTAEGGGGSSDDDADEANRSTPSTEPGSREFFDLDEAATAALGEEATTTATLGDIGPVKSPGVRADLEALGYNPAEFRAVQYEATSQSGTRIITVFEADGQVFFGPHISSANF